jgi:hypothetical protein
MEDFLNIYINWLLEQLNFMKTVVLPIVITVVLTWYLIDRNKKEK